MNIQLMAAMLDNAYREWSELELEFYRQQKANFIVDVEVTRRRKRAAKNLVKLANQYSSLLGEPFDWPREAVEHARANFIDEAKSA